MSIAIAGYTNARTAIFGVGSFWYEEMTYITQVWITPRPTSQPQSPPRPFMSPSWVNGSSRKMPSTSWTRATRRGCTPVTRLVTTVEIP